ncbi:MAG TPA: hypothetical protein HPP58_02020 [Deltaproteobacteria bacterium]|nr:hypothetical protein [Deltaproteobacteria bacterium]HIJ39481.1 hypothetical protein [Deltaproteobacteria bacterium]
MNKLFRLIGIVSGVVILVMFVIVNRGITHVDLFFVEGNTWGFLVIILSFGAGYLTRILVSWLKRSRKPGRSESLERSIIGEI